MIEAERIIVCCPHGITGGPELLHQLVDALRKLGHNAFVSYFPFEGNYECPEIYKKYNAPQAIFSDDSETFVVVPETATWILKSLRHAEAAVWWLSVDNYLIRRHQSLFQDLYIRCISLIKHRLPLIRLRKYKHFVQSIYAQRFLDNAGISSMLLTDYLSSEHLSQRDILKPRMNIVVYNPKKGQKQTQRLREACPDIEFVPIVNMTPSQVADLLSDAKIYVDFGHHPGKDRPPREAAMAGCCVITGRRGSARYSEDVSISDDYKLDDKAAAYVRDFRPLVESIFSDYPSHARCFNGYREMILNEPRIFQQQVEFIFGRRD